MEISVYTYECADGVVGPNGKQHLLDNDDELLLFESVEQARNFLTDQGFDPDGEYNRIPSTVNVKFGFLDSQGREKERA